MALFLNLQNSYIVCTIEIIFFPVCNCIVHERCLKTDNFDSMYSDLFACISIAATLVKVRKMHNINYSFSSIDRCIMFQNIITWKDIVDFPFSFQNPVAHVWSDRMLIKRKFCNVCRKKMEDVTGLCCEGNVKTFDKLMDFRRI